MQTRPCIKRMAAGLLAAAISLTLASAPVLADHPASSSPALNVVGRFEVPMEGLTTDVWASGNYAYIGSFNSPVCSFDLTGVRVVDISNPAEPVQVAFIKDRAGTRTNDVKVEHIETPHFSGEILVTTDEGCGATKPHGGQGGISIWNVTDPTRPRAIKQDFLSRHSEVRNTFIWQQGSNAYVIAVDEADTLDVIIVDITKPSNPNEIARTGAPDWADLDFSEIDGPAVFLSDVWVQGGIAYLSYWDAGLVLLDVSDPANPVFLGDSTYPNPDKSGLPPEGKAQAAVPSADGSLVILGDEDTSPFSTFLNSTIGGMPSAKKIGVALFGPPSVDFFPTPGDVVSVAASFGCSAGDFTAAPGGTADIVLIQRGPCFFSTQAANAQAAGYDAYIVYNDAARGDALINMSPETRLISASLDGSPVDAITIPGIFVGHTVGSAMAAEISSAGVVTANNVSAVGDGEGFMRVIDVTDPANMVQVGSFAAEFTLPPDNASMAGTRSAHNVVVRGDRAYWAWYYNGIRVVDFSDCDAGDGFEGCVPTELAHFGGGDFGAAEPPQNFWGVYLHDHPNGNTYILGSDRNGELWIFDNP